MKISVNVNPAEVARINSVLDVYQQATRKTTADVINKFQRQVAIFASAHTSKADKQKIESELKQIISVRTTTKSGKALKRAVVKWKDSTLARALVVKQLRDKGINPSSLPAGEITRRARAFIAARMKSVGYHKAGWIPALRKFGAPVPAGIRAAKSPPGAAWKATQSRLSSTIQNTARGVEKVQQGALDQAISEAMIDMETYARAELRKQALGISTRINK